MTDETTITETRDGVTVEVEIKRGTGTRDQDKVRIRSHYDDLLEAREEWGRIHGLAAAQAEALRDIQPDAEGDE
jgi:hypothetical protein